MRFAAAFVLFLLAGPMWPQTELWSHVRTDAGPQRLEPVRLSDGQLKSVAELIRHQKPGSIWECEGSERDDLIKGLRFESIPLGPRQNVALAEAGMGCGRGGQGANGAMWVIRLSGAAPKLLATPDQFSGWLFRVQPTLSHGYPDIVLGWHMSAREAPLSYFRFDGKRYRRIGSATLKSDDDGNSKIVP
jgi:hypothetical protein